MVVVVVGLVVLPPVVVVVVDVTVFRVLAAAAAASPRAGGEDEEAREESSSACSVSRLTEESVLLSFSMSLFCREALALAGPVVVVVGLLVVSMETVIAACGCCRAGVGMGRAAVVGGWWLMLDLCEKHEQARWRRMMMMGFDKMDECGQDVIW